MSRPNGGPAFPQNLAGDGRGMSLRDYFAAKAIQGMLAGEPRAESPHVWSRSAYEFADAMLAEREKP